ncbi:hypothetical protein DW886_21510 [Enterocloster aldenensis]|uniref:hypothetical protein n=1 Tax=Enterocloster aldenensis TaxID=358742 RepID=UPI000E4EDAEE|nr:hypothetical protein DW886_21510 [Enterocloster aldenensis]
MKKNLFHVMFANVISLVVGVITSFLLPKYLSIETYANIKTYTFYITYAGFFSLGYNDGMYLKYGGKEITKIGARDIGDNFFNYCILEILITILFLAYGISTHNMIISAFSIGMFSTNIIGYIKSLYQATGEFLLYSSALNIEKIVLFICNMMLLIFLKKQEFFYYIWIQILVGGGIAIWLIYLLQKKIHFIFKGHFCKSEYIYNIKNGFILMMGNFSSSVFTGIDRWFVKLIMSSVAFAMYSFAVSIENIINVFITPITISLYNYFCKDINIEWIIRIKKNILILGLFIISAAFPVKFILERFLPEYMNASVVIFVLFAAQVFHLIIKGIYVNIYKAKQNQCKYLKQMLKMTVISVILNFIFFIISHSMISIALATLCTSIIWLFICEQESLDLRYNYNEILTLLISISVYLICGFFFNSILGFIMYLLVLIFTLFIFMKETTIIAIGSLIK